MTLPIQYGLGGQDWVKDVVVRPFVKPQQDLRSYVVDALSGPRGFKNLKALFSILCQLDKRLYRSWFFFFF